MVVLMDDVGIDKLSIYGRHPNQPRVPNIDAFARQGAVFHSAYSHPSCTSTRSSIMTGRFARRSGHGVHIHTPVGDAEIPLAAVFIPELLRTAPTPYESSAVGKWHMASLASPSGLHHPNLQGFGWYSGVFANLGSVAGSYRRFRKTVNGKVVERSRYVTSDTVDDAISRIKAMKPPWFLYVAFNAAHEPFHAAPRRLRARRARRVSSEADRYNSMVEAMDHEFARLLAGIPEDQARGTTVLLLADNGTPRDVIRPPFSPERAKGTLYEGGVHVPLIVRGPAVTAPEVAREQLVHTVDIFATFAELAGAEIAHDVDGVSFVNALRDPEARGRSTVYSEIFGPNGPPSHWLFDRRMLRSRDWKLIRRTGVLRADAVQEEFFAMRPGAIDEGPNLLAETLTSADEAAYRSLSAALDRLSGYITYDGENAPARR